jgi:hypothetical protein
MLKENPRERPSVVELNNILSKNRKIGAAKKEKYLNVLAHYRKDSLLANIKYTLPADEATMQGIIKAAKADKSKSKHKNQIKMPTETKINYRGTFGHDHK